jgi:hypothetical protein
VQHRKVASKHPKVTAYIPQQLLLALDDWKQIYDIDSRSEAIVTILEDYLEASYLVQYEEQQEGAAPPRPRLSTLLKEINQLKERMTALEESISAAPQEVPSTVLASEESNASNVLGKALNTALSPLVEPGEVQGNVPNTAPPELAEPGEVQSNVPSTAPPKPPSQPLAPLTQSALAKRLGCSDKAVEKQRKHGKESFATWSRQRDPDNIAWTWEGRGGRGQPLRFVPLL